MSWLSKVTDMAGRAEEMLNRLDQSAGEVIQNTVEKARSSSRSTSYQRLDHDVSIPITEETGLPMPSQTHSEYVTKTRKPNSSRPSTSNIEQNEFITMLADEPGHRSKSHGAPSSHHDAFPRETAQHVLQEEKSFKGSNQSIDSIAASEAPDTSAMRGQLLAKDSQIAMLRNKLTEVERKLEKKNEELWDMKHEKESLETEAAKRRTEPNEGMEELRLARQKAVDARESVVAESSQLRKRLIAIEEDNSTLQDQLRLAKFNLAENKREFDEYKDKAAKILFAKEKLVDSLKQGTGGLTATNVTPAELEELKVERDMARADLESCQLQLYNLRSEMDEQETRTREQQRELSDERRSLTEERSQWNITLQMLNEKLECAKVEHEFTKAELRRQELEFQKTLEEKEKELRRTVEEARQRKREEEYRVHQGPGDMASAEKLLQKQSELEQLHRDNQVLTLRLERLQKNSQEVSVPINDPIQPAFRGSLQVQNAHARTAVNAVDSVCYKFVSVIRGSPTTRLASAIYFVVLHFWLFFIIMTYTPEAHDSASFPAAEQHPTT
ncbi:unnamed protein product, partial [Mesorhabditis spiculigera]